MPTKIPQSQVEMKLRNLNAKLVALGFPPLTHQDIDKLLQKVWMPTPVNGLNVTDERFAESQPPLGLSGMMPQMSMGGMGPPSMGGMMPGMPQMPQAIPGGF